jgi:hypothetical protein
VIGSAQKRVKEKWRDDRMDEGARPGWLRATRPRSDHLQSRSPSHGGEGRSSGPIGKGEGKSEMEEGRGTARESLERGVRGRGCEVWKMDEGGEGGRR